MQRFVLFTFLARSLLASEVAKEEALISEAIKSDEPSPVHDKIHEDFKARFEALRKAEEELHLEEENAKAKQAETKAKVQEKDAKVEEAKDDIRIEKAEINDNQKEVVAATADKENAKVVEKMDKVVVQEAKEKENAVATKEVQVERQFNQTLQANGAVAATSLDEAVAVAPKRGWGGTICFFLCLAGIAGVCSSASRRQQLVESVASHPMMESFQQDEENGVRLQGVAAKLQSGFKNQLSSFGYGKEPEQLSTGYYAVMS